MHKKIRVPKVVADGVRRQAERIEELQQQVAIIDIDREALVMERDSARSDVLHLRMENDALRRDIAEVATIILDLNDKLGMLVKRAPDPDSATVWFQVFPSVDWNQPVIVLQTSNEYGDNWQFPIPVNERNWTLLTSVIRHLAPDTDPTSGWAVEMPAEWLYSAVDAALNPVDGDEFGSVAVALLAWLDERTGVTAVRV